MKKHNIVSLAALALVMLLQPIAANATGVIGQVPEPASLSLLAIGLVAVLVTRRKDRD